MCALFVIGVSIAPALTEELSRPTYVLHVDGLACPFCAYGLEKNLTKIEGIEGIVTDIDTGTITVTMEGSTQLREDMASQAVVDAGFTLREFEKIATAGQMRVQD